MTQLTLKYQTPTAFILSISMHVIVAIYLLHTPAVTEIHAGLKSAMSPPSIQFRIKAPQPTPVIQKAAPKPTQTQANPIAQPKEMPEEKPTPQQPVESSATIPLVQNATIVGDRIPPTYPTRALRLQQEGTVILHILVSATGETQEIRLIQSSHYPLLDKEAQNTVKRWSFAPTIQHGKPIKSWIEVPIEFVIK